MVKNEMTIGPDHLVNEQHLRFVLRDWVAH